MENYNHLDKNKL